MNTERSIIITNFSLIVGLALCLISDKGLSHDEVWRSFHCIITVLWSVAMALHMWQHWRLIKAFRRVAVMRRNIITTLTLLVSLLMLVSITALALGDTLWVRHLHSDAAHLFMVVIIVHAVTKIRRLHRMIDRRGRQISRAEPQKRSTE